MKLKDFEKTIERFKDNGNLPADFYLIEARTKLNSTLIFAYGTSKYTRLVYLWREDGTAETSDHTESRIFLDENEDIIVGDAYVFVPCPTLTIAM